MKYLSLIVIALSLALCSCNNNDETPPEIVLPISETFVPVSVDFNINDIDQEQKRQLIHLVNNDHVVNSASEIPDDPMGLDDTYGSSFSTINFREYTLLIKYLLHDWTIDTYSNRYFRNTEDNSYNWAVNIGTVSDTDVDLDDMRFTRFAILVKKLPADAKFRSWYGLTELGWYPGSKDKRLKIRD